MSERDKRLNGELIAREMDDLEEQLIKSLRDINTRRMKWLDRRLKGLVDKTKNASNLNQALRIADEFKLPLKNEVAKALKNHAVNAYKMGMNRSNEEINTLKSYVNNAEEDNNYNPVVPRGVLEYLKKFALEIAGVYDQTTTDEIKDVIKKGITQGTPTDEMIQNIKEKAGSWMSDWHAETVARTETTRHYNAGKLFRYYEEPDFVEALQYNAIMDNRTTELCKHLEGKTIPLSNKEMIARYTPPNHFNCRSSWIPVTTLDEWNDDSNSITMKPPQGFDENYSNPLEGI